MAKLKCYSCPECGSFLEVNRVCDTFDCPFCGAHFDAVDFHGEDLLEQAKKALVRRNFELAREKYEFLLDKHPEELDFLYGYACSVADVKSLEELEDLNKYSFKLQQLIQNDPRYKEGPAALYFAKLAEMCSMARQYAEKQAEYKSLMNKAESGLQSVEPEGSSIGCGVAVYSVAHYFFGAVLLGAIDSKPNAFVVFLYIMVPIFIMVGNWIWNSLSDGKNAESLAQKKKPFYDMKTEAREIENEADALAVSYEKELSELRYLKNKADIESVQKSMPELHYQDKRADANFPSRSTMPRKDPSAVPVVVKKEAASCKKCGAELRLDKEHKLYICDHCGVSYDYESFLGGPLEKAKKCLKDRDFESADKWFSMALEADPANFEANRGRILCAAKMFGFIQLRLNSELVKIDWDAFDKRINEAIANSNNLNYSYYSDVKELFDIAHGYYDTCAAMDVDSANVNIIELLDKKNEYERLFNLKYRKFAEKERNHRVDVARFFADNESTMEAFRMRILNIGLWGNIEEIDFEMQFAVGQYQLLKNAIEDAKKDSNGQYSVYFDYWKTFVDQLNKFSKLTGKRDEYRMLLKSENEKAERDQDFGVADEMDNVRKTLRQYEYQESVQKEKLKETYNLLLDLDRKLFMEKSDSKA